MITRAAIAAINHLLAREAWARNRLLPFAGRNVAFQLLPLPDLHVRILDSGMLVASEPAAVFDLTLKIPPGALPRLLARDEAASRSVAMEGDAELARTVELLFRHLRWEVEEDLSQVVGDVAARRIGEGGRAFAAWQRDAAERLARNFAEYWTEENPLLARPGEVRGFGAEVNALRDDVERLEKRIERLARSVSGSGD